MLRGVPSLADLIIDPEQISSVPLEAIAELRGDLARLDTLLLMRVMTATATNGSDSSDGDRLLTVEESAIKMGVSKDWIYSHVDELTPTRIGSGERKALRFSEQKLERYIKIRSAG